MDFPTKADYLDDLDLDVERFDDLPDADALERTVEHVEARNVDVEVFETGEAARAYLRGRIPEGAEVNAGTSTTLEEIGFAEDLRTADGFHYLPNETRAIDDDEARLAARRRAQAADVWFDSPNAVAATGEIIGVNQSGSGVGAWAYAAGQLVLVTGTNKVVPTFADAIERCRAFALPLEDERARDVYGTESAIGKLVSIEQERFDGRTTLVLLEGRYGF